MTDRIRRDCACKRARHRHGTWLAYACDDCRCLPCTAAHARYTREVRKRRHLAGGALQIDGTGTARRLQALAAVGFGSRELAAFYGHGSRSSIEMWRRGVPLVSVATARRVRDLYDRLWDQRPVGGYPDRTARWARTLGWLPPLAWDDDHIDTPEDFFYNGKNAATRRIPREIDEIAVERAMRGDPVRLTTAEKSLAVVTMTGWGYSAREIAERLGTTDRSVVRRRRSTAAMTGTQRRTYRRNIFTINSDTDRPSAAAFSTAAFHTSSGTRTVRIGVGTSAPHDRVVVLPQERHGRARVGELVGHVRVTRDVQRDRAPRADGDGGVRAVVRGSAVAGCDLSGCHARNRTPTYIHLSIQAGTR